MYKNVKNGYRKFGHSGTLIVISEIQDAQTENKSKLSILRTHVMNFP